jgi:hypothetical protein
MAEGFAAELESFASAADGFGVLLDADTAPEGVPLLLPFELMVSNE